MQDARDESALETAKPKILLLNKRLVAHGLKEIYNAKDHMQCYSRCLQTPNNSCSSFNYDIAQKICTLNSKIKNAIDVIRNDMSMLVLVNNREVDL